MTRAAECRFARGALLRGQAVPHAGRRASTNARQLEARVTLRDEAARLRGLSLRASVRPVARVPRPRRTTEVRWAFFVASVAQ